MKMFKDFFVLCRPHQWYKNVLVFLALFFSGNLFNLNLLTISVYAFLILILISSGNYIINDIIDIKRDRQSPEKRKRPIASGRIKIWQALIFACILIFLALFFSLKINIDFFYSVAALFLATLAYSLLLKKIFIVDIATVSANFVIRAIAGALAISVFVSPWLIVGIFLFAFFLVAGKRYGEILLLGKNAKKQRDVLKFYSRKMLKMIFYLFAVLLLICFALFSYLEHRRLILNSLLFACLVARYAQLANEKPLIAANPERAFSDNLLLVGSIIFIITSTLLLYVK